MHMLTFLCLPTHKGLRWQQQQQQQKGIPSQIVSGHKSFYLKTNLKEENKCKKQVYITSSTYSFSLKWDSTHVNSV